MSYYLWKGNVSISCVMFFRLGDLQRMATESFDEIGPDKWKGVSEHVKKVVSLTLNQQLSTWQMTAILDRMTLTAAHNSPKTSWHCQECWS